MQKKLERPSPRCQGHQLAREVDRLDYQLATMHGDESSSDIASIRLPFPEVHGSSPALARREEVFGLRQVLVVISIVMPLLGLGLAIALRWVSVDLWLYLLFPFRLFFGFINSCKRVLYLVNYDGESITAGLIGLWTRLFYVETLG